MGGPDRRHLAVPARAGEVRHDPAVPAPPDGHGGAGLHPPGPAPGAERDARRDRLPRAGDPGARRDRRLRPHLRRPHPAPPGPRGDARRRSAPTSWSRRRRAASTGPAAEKAWAAVAEFASFGFCKAHAAAFAVPTYQSAWLKAHYPAHFLAGILTHDPGMYPRRLLLEDARQHGIPILPLDVNAASPSTSPRRYVRRTRREAAPSGNPAGGDPSLRHPAGAAGRARHQRRGDPLDHAGSGRPAVPRRGGLPAADDRLPAGDGGARARRGVRPARAEQLAGQEPDRTAGPTCTRP